MKPAIAGRSISVAALVAALGLMLCAPPALAAHGGGGHGGGGFHGGGGGFHGGGFHGGGGFRGGSFAVAPARPAGGFRGGVAGTVPSAIAPLHGPVIAGAFPRGGGGPGYRHGWRPGWGYGGAIVAPLIAAPYWYYPAPAYPAVPYVDPSRYWYYCPALGAYYPDVPECPGGWQAVLPQ